MIRYSFILFILTHCLQISQAQGWGGGLSMGINLSQVDGDLQGGYNQVGLHFGGFASWAFNEKWSMKPEIIFNQKGARSIAVNLFSRFNCIDVPVTANYLAFSWGDLRVGLQGGLMIGGLLSQRNGWTKDDSTSAWSKFDCGMIFGADIQFNSFLGLLIRHNYSMFFKKSTGSAFFHRFITVAVRVYLR